MNGINWIVIIGLVILLDLFLVMWLRHYLGKSGKIPADRSKVVYLLGTYSPLLSWMHGLISNGARLRAGSPLNPEAIPGAQPEVRTGDGEHLELVGEHLPTNQEPEIGAAETNQGQPDAKTGWLVRIGAGLTRLTALQKTVIEVAVVGLVVIFYCGGILDLWSTSLLPGYEAQTFQADDWVLRDSLMRYHRFPLWNGYIHTGLPILGDPMLHVYNPFVTIPVLIFGALNGFKLALILSYLLGALGMWALGASLGFSRPVRVWLGLMYAFAGQPTARFFQGQYLLIFGFAWIPWILAGLIKLAGTRRKLYLALTALGLALLFFCGNAYYTFLIFFAIVIFTLVTLIKFTQNLPWVHLDTGLFKSYAVLGLLSLGLVAIQLMPSIEFWPRMSKGVDVQGSHTLAQIFLDYTSKDTLRPDAYSQLPAREEFYAYIGYTPFLALAALPFALMNRKKNHLLFFGLLLLFAVLWIDLDRMPWRDFYYQTRGLSQFRHLLRALIFGGLALIVLAGAGMDALGKLLGKIRKNNGPGAWGKLLSLASLTGLVALYLFLAAGVLDVFYTNHGYVGTQQDHSQIYHAMSWIRQADEGEYYVRNNPNNGWMMAVLSSNLRFIDAWYHWNDIRNFDGQLNQRGVNARPKYIVQVESQDPPPEADASLVQNVEGYAVYRLSDSLPYAFSVPLATLLDQNSDHDLTATEVTPWTPYISNNQDMEVIAQGDKTDVLVVLVTHYPGWRVKIDGKPAKLEKVGGYLAVRLDPGVHKYSFVFVPLSFFFGLFISLIALGVCVTWIIRDSAIERQAISEVGHRLWDTVRGWLRRPKGEGKANRQLIQAVHRDGLLVPQSNLDLPANESVQLYVEAGVSQASPNSLAFRRWLWASGLLLRTLVGSISLEGYLFIAAITVYLLTRLLYLTHFPIYFFTDEAIQTVSAMDLARNHFLSPDKVLLPTYFKNGTFYNLSLSVYLQLIPYLLFGQSVYLTRLVPVIVSLVAAVSVGLILRNAFQVRYWWLGTMLLSIAPAWFLHSRTAFETAIFASCYAGCLYFYLQYRLKSPANLLLTLVFGALAFYAYSPGQVVMVVTAVGLFISDLNYHWKQRKWLLGGLTLLAILAFPYVRFILQQSDAPFSHLRNLDSYWTQPIPLAEKASRYLSEYLYGLNPAYWFFPNEHDLPRHLMRGYGHLFWWMLPFAFVGLVKSFKHIRQSSYRLLLVAILAAPSGSALVGIGITRVLVFVIPVTLLTALGLADCLDWLRNPRWREWLAGRIHIGFRFRLPTISSKAMQVVLILLLIGGNLGMLRDAVTNGPTWYSDYGLYGMQYGSTQVFGGLLPALLQDSQQKVFISSIWANGADVFPRFFLTPEQQQRISMGSVDTYLSQKLDFDPGMFFVLTAEEYDQVVQSDKMAVTGVENIIPYPDGQPGFYAVHLAYKDNIETIFKNEAEERKKLMQDTMDLWGQEVVVRYSQIDSGQIQDIFDGDVFSLARGLEANPFVLELHFSEPVKVSGVKAAFGSMDFRIKVILTLDGVDEPVELDEIYRNNSNDPQVEMQFDHEYPAVSAIRLEILNLNESDTAKIHFRELQLLP